MLGLGLGSKFTRHLSDLGGQTTALGLLGIIKLLSLAGWLAHDENRLSNIHAEDKPRSFACATTTSPVELDENRLRPRRTDGRDEQFRAGQFRDGFQIRPGLRRQLFPGLAFVRRRAPAFKLRVNRFARREFLRVVGHVIITLPPDTVADTHFDGFHRVETVEVGDREIVNAVHHRRVARGDGIKPTATPRAAGRRAELAAHAVQQVGNFRILGRQRPLTHTRRVRLEHADDAIHAMRRHSRTRASATRRRV